MSKPSMTRKLLLWLSAAITVLWLVAASCGAIVMQAEFGEIFDSALQETGDRLLPLVVDDIMQRDPLKSPVQILSTVDPNSDGYLIYQVRDASGRVLMHSHAEAAAPLPAPLTPGFWQNDKYRIYTTTAVSDTIIVQVADSMKHRHISALAAGLAMLLPVIALVPLSVLAAWLIIRRSLLPVEQFRQEISGKDHGNLVEIDLSPLPKELQPIGRSVNLLLTRLRAALDAEREFTANSAHELRTPIAGALAQTQLMLAQLKEPEARARASQVETSLQKLASLAEKLLQLSRAEAGIGSTGQPVDLVPVLDLVVEDFQRATGNAIVYRHPPTATLPRAVSEDAFAIVIRNMIENAVRHGTQGAPVEVTLGEDGTIRVVNGSPVLPPEQLIAIRKRFQRANATTPGSGLGLSIIERLSEQMNARFDILSPASGRQDGFEARIRI
ncbi:sensor histidine kinase [Agrobacterium vitis]|uniref:sensor histidine kinase n=1 Tax=Agrobacterium vitis TaxID=373 RepID=UPI0015723C79|nr:HAMP domain-containing sensor histidine kinase [Agrobacterium vitis]NSZ19374.1 HAMP domain-containing histidine kinase [Agrobacterium vitis]QZO06241.1 HAMP domain-containing histidine kinase [Agrobacterium vitis]UJL90565.1 HAMP domain-containing histidine kinase [Agrobacterium vitis]